MKNRIRINQIYCDKPNDFMSCRFDGKWNYLKPNGEFLSVQWFDECDEFHDGFGIVKLNNKYNYIKPDGKLLSPDLWFDRCWNFDDELGEVNLNDNFNCIKPDGTFISDLWSKVPISFYLGHKFSLFQALDKDKHSYNYIDKNGNFLFDTWFDRCYIILNDYGFVALDNKYNYIKPDGTFLSERWLDGCLKFSGGFGMVVLDYKFNYIKSDGQFLSKIWFDECEPFFSKRFSRVEYLGIKYNIDKDGNLISLR